MEKFCGHSYQFKEELDEDPKNALDGYLKDWGLGVLYRTMMAKASPIIRFKESQKHPGKYYFITRSARSGIMIKRFTYGPFEVNGDAIVESRADGKKFNTRMTMSEDGLTLTQIATHDSLPESRQIRTLMEDGRMKVVAECNGKSVSRIYVPEGHVESKEDEEL